MTIPLLDLKREYALIHEEVQQAWSAALATMHLLKGENVAAFEREIAAYIGTPHAGRRRRPEPTRCCSRCWASASAPETR